MYRVILSPDKSPESSPFFIWLKKPFHATLTLFMSRWRRFFKALISFDLERFSTRSTANRKTWLEFLQCFSVSLWFTSHVNCSANNVNLKISKKQRHPAQKQNDRNTAKVSGIQFMITNLAIVFSARKFSTKHSRKGCNKLMNFFWAQHTECNSNLQGKSRKVQVIGSLTF